MGASRASNIDETLMPRTARTGSSFVYFLKRLMAVGVSKVVSPAIRLMVRPFTPPSAFALSIAALMPR
jgi:hypothetical protein